MQRRLALMLPLAGLATFAAPTLRFPDDDLRFAVSLPDPVGLRVATWNIVHGTRVSLPTQLFPRGHIEARLAHVARVIDAARVRVVALQEADAEARLHPARTLAERLAIRFTVSTPSHGAALVGRDVQAVFEDTQAFASGPFDPKGFALARVRLPIGEIDVVSVHLHAFFASVRTAQGAELVQAIRTVRASRGLRPLVVMGDFNADWDGAPSELCHALGLRPGPRTGPTYTDLGLAWRLDWVLVSPELAVTRTWVLPPGASDHRAVIADIRGAA